MVFGSILSHIKEIPFYSRFIDCFIKKEVRVLSCNSHHLLRCSLGHFPLIFYCVELLEHKLLIVTLYPFFLLSFRQQDPFSFSNAFDCSTRLKRREDFLDLKNVRFPKLRDLLT